jgi:hypothetical protein
MSTRQQFFTNQSVAGTSSVFSFIGGGPWIMTAEAANWNTGSIKLQEKGPNGTFMDIPSTTLSANGRIEFNAARGSEIQAVFTGGPPTGLYAIAVPR